jgi:hypothetical protein
LTTTIEAVLKSRVGYGFCYSYLYKKSIIVYFLMQILFHFRGNISNLTDRQYRFKKMEFLARIEAYEEKLKWVTAELK